MGIEGPARESGTRQGAKGLFAAVTMGALLLLGVACGGEQTSGDASEGSRTEEGAGVSGATTVQEASSGEAAELARAEVGPKEETNMVPADGREPDPARPLPEDPPEGIEVYPATTNRTVEGPIEYERRPPDQWRP